jgi:hypothetical protein
MTLLSDAVDAVRDFALQPIATFDAFPQTDAQFFADVCFTTLLPLCRGVASASDRKNVLAALAPVIAAAPDVFQASRIAMLCGILVEWGADPTIAIPAILERLTTQLASVTPIDAENEASLFAQAPDVVKAWKGLRYMALPAMTMLCLDVKARQTARQNAALLDGIEALAAHQREVKFLQRLLNLSDGEELIVLHPRENKGFRVRLEAIGTNFHLFSLLQEALVGDPAVGMLPGPRANRKVIATAKGDIPHDRLITDSAVWHYYTWAGLLPDGTLATTPVTPWILGEQTPREIPHFEGDRLILLGPPIVASRGWDSSFFTNLHDALRSKVEVVEILSADEVALRLRRIRNAPRAVG